MIGNEPKGVDGEFGYKVEAQVKYDGIKSGDPDTISWNVTSARMLAKVFGKNAADWLNKAIPIEPSRTEKGYAIYVDEKKLLEIHGGKQEVIM